MGARGADSSVGPRGHVTQDGAAPRDEPPPWHVCTRCGCGVTAPTITSAPRDVECTDGSQSHWRGEERPGRSCPYGFPSILHPGRCPAPWEQPPGTPLAPPKSLCKTSRSRGGRTWFQHATTVLQVPGKPEHPRSARCRQGEASIPNLPAVGSERAGAGRAPSPGAA